MLLRWIQRLYFIIFFKILCVTCARNSSLAFVIDDTRSMWDDIDQVREAAAEIMDIVTREKASEIEDVVLVTFNDPDVVLRKKTSKKHELIEALGKIVVHNTRNYDCPEYALTGIERALQESKPGSYLFVFTDASAKDYHRLKEIKSLCEKKQSQVVFILTGDCRNPRSDNYLAYHEIAKASTGQVFRVDKDDVKDVLNTIKETVKGHKSVVTSGVVPANYYRYTPFPFTVDDKTEYVIVSTSGRNVDVGVTDKPKRGGTRMVTERILWKSSGKVVKFDAPKPGTYYAWVKGDSDVTIVVYARTDFMFDHGFSEFVPKYLDDTSKQPIADRKHHLSISVTDPDHAVDIKTVEILDMNERVLTSLPLRKVNGDFYITDTFVSPPIMFKIQVTGNVKKTGNVIKRISKTAIEPQVPPKPDSKAPEVTITEGTKVDVDYNAEISLTCKVSAYPEPNILWTAADGTVLSSKRSVVELPYDYISYLRLSHVKKSGTYFCKASNDEARNKISKIDVNIKPPIRIMSASTDTKYTKYGEETKLRCHVSSSFPLEIKWNTPLEPSDYSLSSDKMVLTIKSVNLKAQGTYTCEATLKSDPKQKEVITRHVRISDLAPPSISHASPGVITVSHAERIKIICTITGGTPRPSISWQFKGNADSVFRDLSASGEELIVNSASLEDAGQYLCIAKNIKGESDRKTRVIVQKAPVAVILEGSKKTIEYGSTNELTCKTVAYPLPKVIWKDSRGNKLTSRKTINNNEITSYVQIQNIIKSDTYYCYAENIMGNTANKIDLTVTSPMSVQDHPSATTTLQYGATKDITCNIESKYPLKFKWFHQKSSSEISEIHTSDKYTISPNGITLRILSTDLDMVGKYTCEASLVSDENEKTSFTTDVQINNLSPPVLLNTATNQITKQAKDKITIPCKIVGGMPPPIVSWQVMRKGDNVFRDLSASGQELTIDSATLADAGEYRCIAKNAKGQAEKTTGVIVQKAPVAVILEGTKKNIEYGSSNELTCKTVAYPLPKIVWKDSRGNKLTSRETINNNEITSHVQIQNVIKSDTYYCYAENIMGNTVNKIDLTVTSPISVQDHPSATTTLQYGATKDITCNIESKYPLKFKWFHQKSSSEISEIHTSDKYTIAPNGITLRILSTDLDMVGKYTCEASLVSDENEKTSFTTDVQINNLSPPVLLNTASNQITKQDKDKITIPCKIVGGMPPPIVSWQVMPKGDNVFRDLSESGQEFTIDSATLADAGQYRCIAKNAKGQAEKTTGVIVQKAPVAVILEGTKKNIEYGSTNELTCKTVAYPLPKIFWKDSRGNKLTSRETINNNEITSHVQIQNIIKSDTYYCYAENIMGNTVNKIDLTVTSPISVQNHPSATTTLQYGATKDITCNIESKYPLKFKWFHQKSSSEISEIHTSDKYTISPNGITLRILSTDLNMVGKYTCEASLVSDENEKTSFTTDVQINNLSPPVLLNTATNQITKQDTDKITIPCKIVGGMPPPIVSWQVMRKGDNVFRDLSASGQELTIDSATLADAGEYRCIAKNAKGQAEKTTELIVNKVPEAVIDEGATATVTYGSTNEFKCRIVAFPLPKITWSNQKGEKLNSEETITNHETISRLRVENVKINDIYFCYAENDLGKTSSSVQVSVSSAIDFTSNLKESTNVNYGAPTTIVCDAKSSFPVKIKWFYQKNDKLSEISEISTSDKYTISPDKRTLYIASTDLDLVGKYTCEVSLVSDENQKQSYSTKVEINNLKAPEITDVDRTITVMKGQDITTSCKATGIPTPIVTWKFKHAKSDVFTSMPIQADKISNANMDYEWAGTYLCTATNAVGTQSRTIDIVVHGAPEVTNSVYIGVTGDKVLKIPCKVTGVPEPTITWKHRDKIVTSDSKIIVTKNELIIKNPTEKDSNSFTCEATNKYGSTIGVLGAAISDFVDFNEDLNSNIYMKPGESTDIKCLLPYPDPRAVRWYVNGEKTLVLGPSYSLQVANFSNDGNYTCRVNTDQGSESRNYVVNVGYEPSFTTTHASPIVNWYGNKRETLDCNVQAKPKEMVEWFYNGKPLDSEISELPIFGWGHYMCKVSNVHGSVQQSFNVTSNVCVIDRTVNRVQNTPLFISDKPNTWPKFESEYEFLIVNQNKAINLACSTKDQPMNSFKIHPNAHEITAECYKEDQFIVDGKQYNFKDLQCNEYLIPSAVFTKKPCMNGSEIIEVGFKLDSGFLGVYEICYSKQAGYRTQYTKAMMSNVNIGNKVGPSFNLNLGMKTGTHDGKIKKCRYNQRRFVSPIDVAFGPAQIATLSDKNVVLVYEPCEDTSRMSWRDLEEIIQNAMYVMDSFTVWTGASHYNAIGVPRYLWKVVKFDDDSFETAVYVNAPNPVKEDIMCSKYTSPVLSDITESYDDYTYSCTMDEFLKTFKVPLSDFGIA